MTVAPYGPYVGIVRDWHDGDTCHLDVDLGFDHFVLARDPITGRVMESCRIYGINAPELSNPDGSGKAALAYAQQICPNGTKVQVYSYSWDKYGGRFDARLTLPDGTDFGGQMIAAGQAVPYP